MNLWEIIWKSGLFVGALLDGVFVGVFLHELGHALVALVATRQRVVAQVGNSAAPLEWKFGRLTMRLGIKGFRYGFTEYDRESESLRTQMAVALGGPLVSLLIVALCGWWVFVTPLGTWLWIVGFGFFIANVRIAIVSLWPMRYRPFDDKDEIWLSDALDIWEMRKK